MNVGVIGLGKLGLPLAITLADTAGDEVVAWDHSPTRRGDVLANAAGLVDEAGVCAALAARPLRMLNPAGMARQCDVILVVVPTPSTSAGRFDPAAIRAVFRVLGDTDAVIGVVSTVSPGTMRQLAEIQQRLVYCPSLIALGTVMRDLRNAEVQILGGEDGAALDTIAALYGRMTGRARMMTMSFESAELAKLASNVFATIKIGFANQLGQIAHELGGDVDEVMPALTAQSLIGAKGMTPGSGFGGPCLPRDGAAYVCEGGTLGAVAHALNEEHLTWVADRCAELPGGSFAVAGRAYKQGVAYRIESFGDRLAATLTSRGLHEREPSDADIIILALPMPNLRLSGQLRPGVAVLDLWRTHRYLAGEPDLTYVGFGVPRCSSSD